MKQIWDAEELSMYWSLSYEELQLLKIKPYKSHLAFCMQLKYYQYYGIFPESKKDLADIPLQYISEQLGFDNRKDNTLSYYDWEDRTVRRHRQEILDFLEIRKFTERDTPHNRGSRSKSAKNNDLSPRQQQSPVFQCNANI